VVAACVTAAGVAVVLVALPSRSISSGADPEGKRPTVSGTLGHRSPHQGGVS